MTKKHKGAQIHIQIFEILIVDRMQNHILMNKLLKQQMFIQNKQIELIILKYLNKLKMKEIMNYRILIIQMKAMN